MKLKGRELRHKRIRKKVSGTKEKPRLCVYRSLGNMYAQLIDDLEGKTLLSLSTCNVKMSEKTKYGGNVKAAAELGMEFAKSALEKGYSKIVFDRAGYQYHGRVKALADSCRKVGLKF